MSPRRRFSPSNDARSAGVIRRSSLIARQSSSKGGDGGWKDADAQEEEEHYNL